MQDRLTQFDWIQHGLRTLANEGAHALKVGPMSTKLKVSRGSFYWHFRDIDDFRAQLLQTWQDRTTDQVIRELEVGVAPGRLKPLMKRAFAEKRNLERAIRSWAAEDKTVAKAVASVDAKRVGYIARMLVAAGVETRRARVRAAFVYWAYLGQAVVMEPSLLSVPVSALEDIADLFES